MKKRALVISGGGGKGAFAGGMVEFLTQEMKIEYDLFIGTSTGALISTLLCADKIDIAKQAFTTTSQSDIFSVDPFKIIKNKYGTSLKLNHFNIIKQFINKRKTFGESKNLRNLIAKFFKKEYFESIEFQSKEVFISTSNISKNELEYKKLQDFSYEDVIDWIWISCNYAPFMSVVEKEKNHYVDGGFADFIGINKAIQEGATHIDAIVLETKENLVNHTNFNNPFSSIFRINEFMFNKIKDLEIELAVKDCQLKKIDLKLYYLPYILTDNSLIFEPEVMKKWWNEGFIYMSNYVFMH